VILPPLVFPGVRQKERHIEREGGERERERERENGIVSQRRGVMLNW